MKIVRSPIAEETLGRFQVVALPAGERRAFLQAAAREGVAGGRV